MGTQCATGINHVPNINVVLTFRVICVAFKGMTVAMNLNLSTAISTKVRTDTVREI